MLDPDDYLLLSGIQHFAFCRRQWALIHIEAQWEDNARTISGELIHSRAHDTKLTEKRGDMIVVRGMSVLSHALGIQGKCDVVEFHKDEAGVALFGRKGLWLPFPVEYKRGSPKPHDADRLQLCAQAMCLEEMLACPPIKEAYLYYAEIKRREAVPLGSELRETVRSMCAEMRGYYERRHTPRAKQSKSCKNCSLADICLPKLPQEGRVASYIQSALREDAPCENS